MTTCACCNLDKPNTVALNCHPETVLCSDCIDWLNTKRHEQHGNRARITNTDPTFSVADVKRAVAHYKRLGFGIAFHDADYAFALRDRLTIHVTLDPEKAGGTSIYLHVDDADALADEWRGAGAQVSEVVDTDYGKHEGSHTDPDGNVIRFGSPISN